MNKIDIASWQEYKISDLFLDLERGKCPIFRNMAPGRVPVIAASMYNQGITGYYDIQPKYSNKITVSLNGVGSGYFSFHPYPFSANSDCGILHEKIKLSRHTALYLCGVLNRIGEKYGYGEKVTKDKLFKESIKLPSKLNTQGKYEPDWQYMERYIDALENVIKNNVNTLVKTICTPLGGGGGLNKINTSSWKVFKIGELFSIERPKARSVSNYESGEIPFIASGSFNNGVEKFVASKNEELDKGHCITISPVDGYAFYQENDFLGRGGAGSSILILRNSALNKYNAMHICTVIRKVCSKYNYSNMCSAAKLREDEILLPTDANGTPNWKFMENYMMELQKNQRDNFVNLQYI